MKVSDTVSDTATRDGVALPMGERHDTVVRIDTTGGGETIGLSPGTAPVRNHPLSAPRPTHVSSHTGRGGIALFGGHGVASGWTSRLPALETPCFWLDSHRQAMVLHQRERRNPAELRATSDSHAYARARDMAVDVPTRPYEPRFPAPQLRAAATSISTSWGNVERARRNATGRGEEPRPANQYTDSVSRNECGKQIRPRTAEQLRAAARSESASGRHLARASALLGRLRRSTDLPPSTRDSERAGPDQPPARAVLVRQSPNAKRHEHGAEREQAERAVEADTHRPSLPERTLRARENGEERRSGGRL